MKINMAQVKNQLGSAQSFSFTSSAEELGLDKTQTFLLESVFVKGQVSNKGMSFQVAGEISAQLKLNCSRCLEDMITLLNVSINEEYQEVDGKEFEKISEMEINCFTGDEIDITDLVRETLLLAEPIKPVCSETCRGLCPECGTNLNINTCGCNPVKIDPRLAVLEKLLSKD